ncbi:MAG: HAMP domain-containing sensor histidine kinase [Clostridia bacterium]|nr:HAMP domain-containing sensor histidine kinase [Clostridia bacterium]
MTADVEWSHDLRLPLQQVTSCAQLLRLELDGRDGAAAEYVELLMDGVGQLRRLLDRALEREDRDAPRWVEGDLPACVRELCRRCRPWAAEAGVALRCSGNVADLRMALDEDKLSRVLLNLIANALRFTPRGGRIRVTWRALGDFAEVCVADDGPGIPPERLPWVFLDGETEGGHGHGLSIARTLARTMGGELTARSTRGAGSAFTLRLPVRAVRAG